MVLWFEHDLYDQLQLLDVLALAHEAGVAPELIVVDSFPGKPSFHGLGELTAAELETLWETRRPATEAELAAAAAAWTAFRAPEPDELMRLAATGTPELPLLAPALRRLLEELPAEGDGLSRTERQALGAIAGGARTPIRGVRRLAGARGGAVPRRRVVLPDARGARAGPGPSRRDWRRSRAAAATAAR